LRHFLLETSILDRLCGPLCDVVTASEGGQETLERLERENLFLMPLDNNREWFRYHRLFSDFLYIELNRRHAVEVADLHGRAARWYLDHDLPEQAFHHAIEGRQSELAVEIFDRYLNAKLLGGEFSVVKRWLDSLPPEWQITYPVLGLARAGYLAFTGAFAECVRCIDEVEQRLTPAQSEDTRRQLARVTAVRCLVACTQNDLALAERYANQALRDLPEQDIGFRPGIYVALGDTFRQNGFWEEARQCYLKVLDFTHAPSVRIGSVHVFGALADLALRQGNLRDADSYWRKALSAIQDEAAWGHVPLPVIGWVYIRRSEILYEWNERAKAWDHLSRGLERAELGGDVRALIAGYLLAGWLKLAGDEVEAATAYLERARPLLQQAPFPGWTSRFERLQLKLWLAEERLRTAVEWAEQRLQEAVVEERAESEVGELAIAHVLLVKGDTSSVERASALLDRLFQAAEATGRMGVMIEALALKALARWRHGDRAGAMTILERALRLAEPESYLRLFADFGLPMARLLQDARSRAVLPDYVGRLLAAFSVDLAFPASGEMALPEPLSPREQEILELVAAGLANQEIADKLMISPETVKKHAGSIYGKLGVSNRTEAAARARELDLLD
jgi:LuxR family transcriptional regulator, maltose regulon positive regulatory protein